jgi:hypothetical protein
MYYTHVDGGVLCNIACTTNIMVYLHVSGLFVCTMYNSHGLEWCTIYNSHGVYLRVLWTICMYKFSSCHTVVFHGFLFHLPISVKIASFLTKFVRKSSRRFLVKASRFIGETGRISVFSVFTVHPSSPVHFDRIFLNFTDFF